MENWTVRDLQLISPRGYEAMDESTWSGDYAAMGIATNGVEQKKFSASISVKKPLSGGPLRNLVSENAIKVLTRRFNEGRLPVPGENIEISLPGDAL